MYLYSFKKISSKLLLGSTDVENVESHLCGAERLGRRLWGVLMGAEEWRERVPGTVD